jgi:hypothetical protein
MYPANSLDLPLPLWPPPRHHTLHYTITMLSGQRVFALVPLRTDAAGTDCSASLGVCHHTCMAAGIWALVRRFTNVKQTVAAQNGTADSISRSLFGAPRTCSLLLLWGGSGG